MQPPQSGDSRRTVLLVDDEPNVREAIALNLRKEGLDVAFAGDGAEAVDLAREIRPDLIVLDIMLPGMDGFEVCRTIREESTVPILVLSARGEEIDRIVGLELGADDFLAKPFAMRELVARVRAMLRRARMTSSQTAFRSVRTSASAASDAPEATGTGTGQLVEGDIAIDVPRRTAIVAGTALDLKPREFDLLVYFARHPGIVLSRSALLREVWEYEHYVDTRTVDVHVRWLRQKIEPDAATPIRITTVRGHGYRFVSHDTI